MIRVYSGVYYCPVENNVSFTGMNPVTLLKTRSALGLQRKLVRQLSIRCKQEIMLDSERFNPSLVKDEREENGSSEEQKIHISSRLSATETQNSKANEQVLCISEQDEKFVSLHPQINRSASQDEEKEKPIFKAPGNIRAVKRKRTIPSESSVPSKKDRLTPICRCRLVRQMAIEGESSIKA
ncbi:unnamed protein product [Caenorhabditis auriculariae]|uniref:Uncharacterized protein n=1 Tax=Caenorhabditis auriculariae TaxID=2777116 RepID=A0A8S1GQZ2_9PELO|nr:unnamed protein product [Caenorhabditis auriculariae]